MTGATISMVIVTNFAERPCHERFLRVSYVLIAPLVRRGRRAALLHSKWRFLRPAGGAKLLKGSGMLENVCTNHAAFSCALFFKLPHKIFDF